MKQRRKFARAFRVAAVKKVLEEGLSYGDVADELGIEDTLIESWQHAFETDGTLQATTQVSPSALAELNRLRAEQRQLKMECEILRKANDFLADNKG